MDKLKLINDSPKSILDNDVVEIIQATNGKDIPITHGDYIN